MANRKSGGRMARVRGEIAEQAVLQGFEALHMQHRCVYSKTYPKSKVIYSRGQKHVIFTGVGAPDIVAAVKTESGSGIYPLWLEIKTSANLSAMRSKSVHQYTALKDMVSIGGLGAYIVLWRRDKTSRTAVIDEWRIHPISTIEHQEFKGVVILKREDGIKLSAPPSPQLTMLDEEDFDVWLTQPSMPDIDEVVRILIDYPTEDDNA